MRNDPPKDVKQNAHSVLPAPPVSMSAYPWAPTAHMDRTLRRLEPALNGENRVSAPAT